MTVRLFISVFPSAPGSVLVHVPVGYDGEVRLPVLRAPLTRIGVAEACGRVGVPVTVVEAVPGQWAGALTLLRNAAKANAANKQRENQALRTLVMKGATNPEERDRARIVERLHKIDAERREMQRAVEANGPSSIMYKYAKGKVDELTTEQLGLQAQLGLLKAEAKKAKQRDSQRLEQCFVTAARAYLDPELFEALLETAREDLEEASGKAEEAEVWGA